MFFFKFKIHWFEIWFFWWNYIFLDIGKLMGKCTQSEINSQIFRTKRQIHFGNIHFVIQHLKSDGEPRQGNINSNCNWFFGWSYFQSKRSTNKMQNISYFPSSNLRCKKQDASGERKIAPFSSQPVHSASPKHDPSDDKYDLN